MCIQIRCLIFALILATGTVFAQSNKLDSLKNALKRYPKTDPKKIELMIDLCEEMQQSRDQSLSSTASQLLTLSGKLNFKKGIAYGYYYMAATALNKQDRVKNKTYLLKALELMKEQRDETGIGNCYYSLGRISGSLSEHNEAISYYEKSIVIREKEKDIVGIANAYSRIGGIYDFTGNYKKAIEIYLKTIQLSEEAHQTNITCQTYIGMAIVFYRMNEFQQCINNLNKALTFIERNEAPRMNLIFIYTNMAISYQGLGDVKKSIIYQLKALKACEEFNDKTGLAIGYCNLGSMYMALDTNGTTEAMKCFLKGMQISREINNDQALSDAYMGLGACYERKKNYFTAMKYYEDAVKLYKFIDYKAGLRDAYLNISKMLEKNGNYPNALLYHKQYSDVKDSLLNEATFKQTKELNTRFETEKKEKEILLLTKDQQLKDKTLKEQRMIRLGLSIGLSLFLILSFVLYGRYRFKKKANSILEKQKLEIHKKNTLITDSIDYAKTIQEAVLPAQDKLAHLLPEHFILYRPKDIVSGDFYWVGKKGDEIICVAADCTGHGVPGAFMSLLGINMLENTMATLNDCTPSAILDALNKEILNRFSTDNQDAMHGMDIAVISINFSTMQLNYAGAKNALYLVQENHLQEVKANKFSTGTQVHSSPVSFTNHTIPLQKGAMIYLFSDGFPDQKGGPQNKKYYYQPFQELCLRLHQLDMETQRKGFEKEIDAWKGEHEQIDDILIMGIRM